MVSSTASFGPVRSASRFLAVVGRVLLCTQSMLLGRQTDVRRQELPLKWAIANADRFSMTFQIPRLCLRQQTLVYLLLFCR